MRCFLIYIYIEFYIISDYFILLLYTDNTTSIYIFFYYNLYDFRLIHIVLVHWRHDFYLHFYCIWHCSCLFCIHLLHRLWLFYAAFDCSYCTAILLLTILYCLWLSLLHCSFAISGPSHGATNSHILPGTIWAQMQILHYSTVALLNFLWQGLVPIWWFPTTAWYLFHLTFNFYNLNIE